MRLLVSALLRTSALPLMTALVLLSALPADARAGAPAGDAAHGVRGLVVDAETAEPIHHATVRISEIASTRTGGDGTFVLEGLPAGLHRLHVSHIAYEERTLDIQVPTTVGALSIALTPSSYAVGEVHVVDQAIDPSNPVSVTVVDRTDIELSAGNIANDPLRTIQTQPGATWGGIDFNSRTSIRGGDPDEHRVYLDGFPLDHYAHLGGFAEVIHGDLIASAALLPGAAPLRYRGNLTGAISLASVEPDSASYYFRYDITSLGAAMARRLRPETSVLAAAKGSFFNLPVYQQLGVDEKSFRDLFAKVTHTLPGGQRLSATVIAATDTEIGRPARDVETRRSMRSLLVGALWTVPFESWTVRVRPHYSGYDKSDDLEVGRQAWEHQVHGGRLAAEIERRFGWGDLAMSGLVGGASHRGRGGAISDLTYALAAEGRWHLGGDRTLVLGLGGTRERWTAGFEPEGYGSLRLPLGNRLQLGLGFRRSHQSPFLFAESQQFASIPLDPGDLRAAYLPAADRAPAVRSEQVSASLVIAATRSVSVHAGAYGRRYQRLLTWQFSDAFLPLAVTSDGEGEGSGYEIRVVREQPAGISGELSFSRARIDKREGTLSAQRASDYDLPDGWRAKLRIPLTEHLSLSMAWQDLAGRPYTILVGQAAPLPDQLVNGDRLPRYQRLDLKLHYHIVKSSSDITLFLDFLNVLNRGNVSTMFAYQSSPGEMTSIPYGGTRLFPIVGASVRTW
jgi:hypothetical protein